MKTPREVLLERHQPAKAKLDQIRHAVVAELTPRPFRELGLPFALRFWRELFWPHPKAWAALAGVWLVMLGVQFTSRDESPRSFTQLAPPSPQVRELLKQQERLFAELIGSKEHRQADRPKAVAPQPRSLRREEMLNA